MVGANATGGVGDVFGQEVQRATINLRKIINTAILTGAGDGTDSSVLLAFPHIMDTSGTIYGKARGSYATLQGNESPEASAKITLDKLRGYLATVLPNGAERKNMVFITSYTQERFIRNIFQKMQIAPPMSGRFGFEGMLEIDGVPIMPDQHCAAAELFLVDLSVTRVAIQQAPTLTEFGITGDSRKAFIKMYFNLYCTNPNHNYKVTGLATT